MKKKILTILTVLLMSITTTACSSSKVTPQNEANNALNAIKDQDYDTIDKYFTQMPLGDFMYQDPEGFKMYTKNMTWEIGDMKEENEEYKVSLKITNANMSEVLEKNTPKVGDMMPNPEPSEVDKASKKDFDIVFTFIKKDNEYILNNSEEFCMELLDIITGGGISYLAEFNEKHEIK